MVGDAIGAGLFQEGVAGVFEVAEGLGQVGGGEPQVGSAGVVAMLGQQGGRIAAGDQVVHQLGVIAGSGHWCGTAGVGQPDAVSNQAEPVVGGDLLKVVQRAQHPAMPARRAGTYQHRGSDHVPENKTGHRQHGRDTRRHRKPGRWLLRTARLCGAVAFDGRQVGQQLVAVGVVAGREIGRADIGIADPGVLDLVSRAGPPAA